MQLIPIVGLLVFFAIFLSSYAVKPLTLGRSIRTVELLCVAAFCVVGFLASFELPGVAWKLFYAALGAIVVGGATIPWLTGSSRDVS